MKEDAEKKEEEAKQQDATGGDSKETQEMNDSEV